MVNLMAHAGSNATKSEMRVSGIRYNRATEALVIAPLCLTSSYVSRTRKITSNVILSTPAFLLRTVLARVESFAMLASPAAPRRACRHRRDAGGRARGDRAPASYG